MTPDLSRRLAWVLQFLPFPEHRELVDAAFAATTYEKLPTEIQARIEALEAQHGKAPYL